MNIFADTQLTGRVGLYVIVHSTQSTEPFPIDRLIDSGIGKGLTPRDIQNLRYEIEANEQSECFSIRVAGFPAGNVAFLNAQADTPGRLLQKLIVRTGEYIVGVCLDLLETPGEITRDIIKTLNDRDRKCLHFQQRRSVETSAFSFTFLSEDISVVSTVREEIKADSLWCGTVQFNYCYAQDTNDLMFTLTETVSGTLPEIAGSVWYDQYHRDSQMTRVVIKEVQDLPDGTPFTDLFEFIVLTHVHTESIDIYKDKDYTFAYKIIEKHRDNPSFFEEMAERNKDYQGKGADFMLYPTFRKVLVREAAGKYVDLSNNCVSLQA